MATSGSIFRHGKTQIYIYFEIGNSKFKSQFYLHYYFYQLLCPSSLTGHFHNPEGEQRNTLYVHITQCYIDTLY